MIFESKIQEIYSMSSRFPPSNIHISQKVFSDLVLAKKWKHVEYKPMDDLETCVFLAKEPGLNNDLCIVPVHGEDKLSLNRISKIFNILSENNIKRKVTLAIYSLDSTIVYYHISKGLLPKEM